MIKDDGTHNGTFQLNLGRFRVSVLSLLFFLSYLLLGVWIVDDYGVSWDETHNRLYNGKVVYEFIAEGNSGQYLDSGEKYHGSGIELPLYAGEKWLGLSTTREVFLYRHFANFFLFFFSANCFLKQNALLIKE